MAEAQQAGLDAGALLETIDPDKIAAANVPSPAGITAAALDRAAAEAKIPAWTEREYGHFTDETLVAELAHARAQLDSAVTERAALAEEARALAEAVAAGRGPAVQRVEQELAELRDIGHELTRHGALEADWRGAVLTAREAAIGAALAENERDQLGTRSRRRAELDTRILELRQQEAEAQSAADAVADQAKALVRVPTDQAERAQFAERIATAEIRHNELRQTAAAKNQEAARRMAIKAATEPDRRALDLLDSEVRTRAELRPHRLDQESLGRDAQMSATITPTGAARMPEPGLQAPQVPTVPIDPPLPAPSIQPSI